MAKKKKKEGKRKALVIAGVVAGIAVIAGGVTIGVRLNSKSDDESGKIGVNVSNAGSVVNNNVPTSGNSTVNSQRVDTTVQIQMEDFAAVVGTQVKVAAVVTPSSAASSVLWQSSDTSVFTVTNEGAVVIRGIGKGVLTASAGSVSDSIVIEGIESVASGSSGSLPVYTASNGDIGYYTGSTTTSSDTESVWDNGTDEWGEEWENYDSNGEGEGTDSSNAGGGTQTNTDASVIDGNQYNVTNVNTSLGSNGGYDSSNVGEVLPSAGFTQAMSNVYTYEDADGKYYGEIVTQPGVTIIYIKERSSDFDSKVVSVIASMIPESYNQVWNNFLTAGSDRSFVADNKKVRIVVGDDGGHSQIVIYN